MFLTILSSIGFLIVCVGFLIVFVAAAVLTLAGIAFLFSMDGTKRIFVMVFALVALGFVVLHNMGAFAYPLA